MTNDRPIRVLVADDHPLMRAGIAGEINAQRDMVVVAEAADGESAIALFRVHRPDVTLMDIKLPRMSGIESLTAIRAEFRQARIMVLTSIAGDVKAMRAFKAGAVGFLLKDTFRSELVTCQLLRTRTPSQPPNQTQGMASTAIDTGYQAGPSFGPPMRKYTTTPTSPAAKPIQARIQM